LCRNSNANRRSSPDLDQPNSRTASRKAVSMAPGARQCHPLLGYEHRGLRFLFWGDGTTIVLPSAKLADELEMLNCRHRLARSRIRRTLLSRCLCHLFGRRRTRGRRIARVWAPTRKEEREKRHRGTLPKQFPFSRRKPRPCGWSRPFGTVAEYATLTDGVGRSLSMPL
jgi:hypothetical protein